MSVVRPVPRCDNAAWPASQLAPNRGHWEREEHA